MVGKVDTDSEMSLAQRFGISAIPTLIFFKNGAELKRSVGVVSEDALKAILEENL